MTRHIHFVGIGGAGLSALARVMLNRGEVVSGSDATPGPVTESLALAGAQIFNGHSADYVRGADLVVITSAAAADHPEAVAAQRAGIPVRKRREFLREVTAGYDTLAIAGSHGKTTTTAMIASVLLAGGLDPTAVVGGILVDWGANARTGISKWFVVEADEYDYAFLGLEPTIAVVTNVEYDHPDIFPTPERYRAAFGQFLDHTRPGGAIVVCGDEPVALALARGAGRPVVTFGLGMANDWRAVELCPNSVGGNDARVLRGGEAQGSLSLRVPGPHNVSNALAALAVAARLSIPFETAQQALAGFHGTVRRFEVRGTYRGAILVDDYAHHPTEIRATLRAAREQYPDRRLWALFQPHTFSRLQALLDEFAAAFTDADRVLIVPVYAGREQKVPGVTSDLLAARMGGAIRLVESLEEAQEVLSKALGPGDVLLALGAGNVSLVTGRLVALRVPAPDHAANSHA